jgi:hypothetical protein
VPVRVPIATYGAVDPKGLAEFWAIQLGREILEDAHGLLLLGDKTQLGLRFVQIAAETSRPHRMHLHLTSTDLDDQQDTVRQALALGARHLDVGQRDDEDHVVLADPGGYEFCVIEPGSVFLAGCGFFGELACDGSRNVGVFWSAALDWPLVWDQDGETAIQSPEGGTKIAWGGPPVRPKALREGQLLQLLTDGDHMSELERLVALGAVVQEVRENGISLLTDPDGFDFLLMTVESTGAPLQ